MQELEMGSANSNIQLRKPDVSQRDQEGKLKTYRREMEIKILGAHRQEVSIAD